MNHILELEKTVAPGIVQLRMPYEPNKKCLVVRKKVQPSLIVKELDYSKKTVA